MCNSVSKMYKIYICIFYAVQTMTPSRPGDIFSFILETIDLKNKSLPPTHFVIDILSKIIHFNFIPLP